MKSVEEVFFSKVSGNFFLEIFEKSIDKHKIDAILNAPSFRSGPFWGAVLTGGHQAGGFHGRIRFYHPDTRIPMKNGREVFCTQVREAGTAEGRCVLCRGVFFEKC